VTKEENEPTKQDENVVDIPSEEYSLVRHLRGDVLAKNARKHFYSKENFEDIEESKSVINP
jgi:hypothetical protein